MPKASIALFLAASVIAVPAFAVEAPSRHDGTWSVSLVTKAGNCDPSLSSQIQVREGRVNESMLFAKIIGAVNASGLVNLHVVRGSDSMNASGKISGARATGSWTAPSRNCSGSWTAVKA